MQGGGGAAPPADRLGGLPDPPRLADVWRVANPDTADFTHKSAAHHTGARLDRWLVSAGLLQGGAAQSSICALHPLESDHLPVSLTLELPGRPLVGKGLSALAPAQLDVPEVRRAIEAAIEAAEQQLASDSI